jgi:hypothetical protein
MYFLTIFLQCNLCYIVVSFVGHFLIARWSSSIIIFHVIYCALHIQKISERLIRLLLMMWLKWFIVQGSRSKSHHECLYKKITHPWCWLQGNLVTAVYKWLTLQEFPGISPILQFYLHLSIWWTFLFYNFSSFIYILRHIINNIDMTTFLSMIFINVTLGLKSKCWI